MIDFWKKYLLSFLTGLFTAIVLVFLNKITIWWVFLIILFFWFGGLFYLNYLRHKKENYKEFWPFLLITAFSFICLILILENIWIKLFVSILLVGILMFLVFHSPEKSKLSYLDKPARRLIVMILVMDLFCLSAFFYAINLFFQNIPFWLMGLFLSLVSGFISIGIWKNYFLISYKNFIFWFVITTLISWEISWVLHFLPFGYLVLGLLFTWAWYIINLLIRFHLTNQGVVWRKQLIFLVGNMILYFLILFFFVRWI